MISEKTSSILGLVGCVCAIILVNKIKERQQFNLLKQSMTNSIDHYKPYINKKVNEARGES